MKRFVALLRIPLRHHLFGGLAIVAAVGLCISSRITDRRNFADSELHRDVMERWGAPIAQPMPSVRFVPSGAVFNSLAPLPLASQDIAVDATMNYRKRGLVYFSGFDFDFRGDYVAENDQGRDIDVAFVFPINLQKNKVLLSNLVFTVDGAAAKVELPDGADKFTWTGRLKAGARASFHVAFRGRGLDSFVYSLDPAAPVRNFRLAMRIAGGANFDYADGVVPAGETKVAGAEVSLRWSYASLQSGIPVGVILPSEKSYDEIIATMVRRAWAPFLLFSIGLAALCAYHRRRLRAWESWLVAAAWGLSFVLLAYLAAFMNFYVAWVVSLTVIGGLIWAYLRLLLPASAGRIVIGLLGSSLCVPTAAVFLQGYTGLIYTLETLGLVTTLMVLTTRPAIRELIEELGAVDGAGGGRHVEVA
jgi:hypothetical protein